MDILGISCSFHDAAAALLRDGWLVAEWLREPRGTNGRIPVAQKN